MCNVSNYGKALPHMHFKHTKWTTSDCWVTLTCMIILFVNIYQLSSLDNIKSVPRRIDKWMVRMLHIPNVDTFCSKEIE